MKREKRENVEGGGCYLVAVCRERDREEEKRIRSTQHEDWNIIKSVAAVCREREGIGHRWASGLHN